MQFRFFSIILIFHHDVQLRHNNMMAQRWVQIITLAIRRILYLWATPKSTFRIFLKLLTLAFNDLNNQQTFFIIINRVLAKLWWPKSGLRCKFFRIFRVILTLNFWPDNRFEICDLSCNDMHRLWQILQHPVIGWRAIGLLEWPKLNGKKSTKMVFK